MCKRHVVLNHKRRLLDLLVRVFFELWASISNCKKCLRQHMYKFKYSYNCSNNFKKHKKYPRTWCVPEYCRSIMATKHNNVYNASTHTIGDRHINQRKSNFLSCFLKQNTVRIELKITIPRLWSINRVAIVVYSNGHLKEYMFNFNSME